MSKCEWPEFAEVWNDLENYPEIDDVAEKLGISRAYVRKKVSTIRRAYWDGKQAPFLAYRGSPPKFPLVTELTNADHEYTEIELIKILRHLKLQEPSRFITRNYFRSETSIPDSAWTQYFGTFQEFIRVSDIALSRHQHAFEKKIAIHKSRDHYRELNERQAWGHDFDKPNDKDFQTYVCCSDLHDVDIDPFYLRVLLDTIKRVQPDKILLVGDILDLPEFGKYTVDPREWDAVGRIKFAHNEILQPMREAAPDAQIDYFEGNHELRMVKLLADATPAVRAVLSDLHGWSAREFFGLDKFEVNYITKADLAAGTRAEITKELKKNYKVYHECFAAAHYPMYRNYELAGVSGHIHNRQIWPVKTMMNGTRSWLQMGCGHKQEAEYCDAENVWELGFAIVDIHVPSQSVNIQSIPVTNIAQVGGKYYEREEGEMVGFYDR